MNNNNGKFICPKCDTKKMGDFTNWLNKIKYNNNKQDIYWIFYTKVFGLKKNVNLHIKPDGLFQKSMIFGKFFAGNFCYGA
jgi:hypothetical protein